MKLYMLQVVERVLPYGKGLQLLRPLTRGPLRKRFPRAINIFMYWMSNEETSVHHLTQKTFLEESSQLIQ